MQVFPRDPMKSSKPRPGFIRRNLRRAGYVAGGPIATIGLKEIDEGRSFINGLLSVVRTGPIGDARLKTHPDGSIDLAETAFSYGMSMDELYDRFCQRRSQTCRSAYLTFGLGLASLCVWLYSAMQMPLTSGRILAAIEFIPFCLLFFLLSFKAAWLNWQLRTLRLGSAGDFMRTTEPFLPRVA